ncbi:GNAT family N-acetyltransferase [Hydrogenophaga laconesensis]|uniref:ElaA protein n=1 Tax=Hydrogenophaga laconesensis TaxID=1805971 RepID=A0ABU1VDC7_9BURK|nr:GNAT family N-acetyltransferase [Hydrogenophaga laconesensis]MDR7095486.1 ElaA protein [Hydrogenophaga laconesensis]
MNPRELNWRCLPFDALHARTLYNLLQLRTEVFVMEQTCIFQDMDGADPQCFHLLGEEADGTLVAYARLVPAGLKFTEASIGRVVTLPAARGGGLGHVLMREAVRALHGLWGVQPIRIGAQARLEAFYRQHDFVPASEIYIEDGIDHVEMTRAA